MSDNGTKVSLKEYLDREIKYLKEEITKVEQRTSQASDKSLTALNVRLETMNEFRNQINSERASYVTREMLDIILDGLRREKKEDSRDSTARWIGVFAIAVGIIEVLVIVLRP